MKPTLVADVIAYHEGLDEQARASREQAARSSLMDPWLIANRREQEDLSLLRQAAQQHYGGLRQQYYQGLPPHLGAMGTLVGNILGRR